MCAMLGIVSKKNSKAPEKPKRIAVIQLWGVGETILTLPAIKALRKKYPKAEIDILCTARNKDVYYDQKVSIIDISLNPLSIASLMLKNYREYDIVIDLEEYLNISALIAFFVGKFRVGYSHSARSRLYHQSVPYNDNQHVSQTFMDPLQVLGIRQKVTQLEDVRYPKEKEQKVKKLLQGINTRSPMVGISAGAAESAKSRMWPEEKWAALIDKISAHKGSTFILLGAGDVKETNKKIISKVKQKKNTHNFAGITDVPELFALCKKLDLMISIDSGPMHIAAAQRIKTIGLFCPNTPIRFGPLGKNNVSIYKPILKKPCINVHKGEVPECRGHNHMSRITVEDVFKAVKRLL